MHNRWCSERNLLATVISHLNHENLQFRTDVMAVKGTLICSPPLNFLHTTLLLHRASSMSHYSDVTFKFHLIQGLKYTLDYK